MLKIFEARALNKRSKFKDKLKNFLNLKIYFKHLKLF